MASPRYQGGVGRRKTAVATVRLLKGSGSVTVNEQPLATYFPLARWQSRVMEPLRLVGREKSVDVVIKVHGGGVPAQAEASLLGVARALLTENEELKGTLKKAGLLTRDAREKERRKYGLKKARKSPQFSKR